MHVHGRGDIAQHQRNHGLVSPVEKGLLAFDDGGRDFEQGFVAAVQAFDEPARLLQVIA